MKETMSINEIASRYGVTRQTVHNWIADGCPAARYYHGLQLKTELKLEEVEAWLKFNRKEEK